MNVSDLVHLNPIHFYKFDDCLGIVLDKSKDGGVNIYKVAWIDNSNGIEDGWYMEHELELINEGG